MEQKFIEDKPQDLSSGHPNVLTFQKFCVIIYEGKGTIIMKRILPFLIALSFLLNCVYAQDTSTYENILVAEVINGDTLELANGERVKLIGIDSPEMDTQDGLMATLFVKVIAEGKKVTLEFDEEKKDKDGRLLAYAYIPAGTGCSACLPHWAYGKRIGRDLYIFLNATILKAGYVSSLSIAPNIKYADVFTVLYEEAREKKPPLPVNEEEGEPRQKNNDFSGGKGL